MKHITAKELRAILAAVPDDQPVFVCLDADRGEHYQICSYSLHRYNDNAVQVTLFTDDMCGMDI